LYTESKNESTCEPQGPFCSKMFYISIFNDKNIIFCSLYFLFLKNFIRKTENWKYKQAVIKTIKSCFIIYWTKFWKQEIKWKYRMTFLNKKENIKYFLNPNCPLTFEESKRENF